MTDYEKLKELLDKTFAEQYEKRGLLTAHHTAQDLLSNGVIVPPCKVGDLPDRVFSHNEIISIWVEVPEEHYSQRLWRGMAWDIPEEYKEMPFKRIFGTIPESISKADTINVLVELTKEEAEKAL